MKRTAFFFFSCFCTTSGIFWRSTGVWTTPSILFFLRSLINSRKSVGLLFIGSPCQNRSFFPEWRDMNRLFGAFDLAEKTGLAIPQILNMWPFLLRIETENVLGTDLNASTTPVTTFSVYFLNSHIHLNGGAHWPQ